MRQTSYTTRVMRADEGRYLTQADGSIADKDRIVTDTVYLAVNADPADWREITADEADRIRRAQTAETTASDNPIIQSA